MKIAVIVPPAFRPFMPSFFAGVVAEKIRKSGHIVDVKDVNLSFFDYIYNDSLKIKYDNGEKNINTCFFNRMIANKLKPQTESVVISKKEFDVLKDEIELRNRILEKHIPGLKFGFFDVRHNIQGNLENTNGPIKEILNQIVQFEDYDNVAIVIESNNQLYFASIILEIFGKLKNRKSFVIVPQHRVVDESPLTDNKSCTILRWNGKFESLLKDFLDEEKRFNDFNNNIDNRHLMAYDVLSFNIDDFSNSNYYYPIKKYPIATSFGCSYGECKFCPYNIGKKPYILKKDKVFLQLDTAVNKGYSLIEFVDSNIHINYLVAIAHYLIDNNLKIKWIANTRLYDQLVLEENCRILQESGCKKLFIGLESYDQQLLNDMNKGILATNMVKVLTNLKKYNIVTHTSFLFGFVGETQEQANRTEAFIKDNINLLDIIEINHYVNIRQSKDVNKKYDVVALVMRLRQFVEDHNKSPSYYNIYRSIID